MMLKTIPTGTRRWIIIAAVAIVAVLIAMSVLSNIYIDLLWFREVRLSSVFWTRLKTNFSLGLIFGALFFALLYANLLIVRRTVPPMRALSPEQEAIERVRQLAEPYLRWLIPVGAAFISLIVGISASHEWSTFLLWRHGRGQSFGTTEPLFHRDPSFYIFSLPWWHFLQSWLFSSFLGVTLIVVVAHFVWGNIQPGAPAFADKAPPLVRAHVSVLLGLVLLARAWGYYLGRFDLLTSSRGVVEGASYTDIRAQLPALNVLTLVAAICAVLFLVNIRLRRWSLPIIAVGLLAAVSILLGRAYPAFVQQFSVKPQELQRETPYIGYNIDGTRKAFGLDTISVNNLPDDAAASPATAADVADNQATVSNIRLWRPSTLLQDFAQQRVRQYYEFRDVDVDRYKIGTDPRVLMISGREVTQNGITTDGRTWQNTHLVYTHGFGAVAAQVNTATVPEGQPVLTLSKIPPEGQPAIDQPRLYYGELSDVPFVVTRTGAAELDYEGAPTAEPYSGEGGIPMGNIVRRSLFAWRFNDFNLLISGLIHPDSRIMINRQLQERAPKPAPFLKFDGDPYLAVVKGQPTWIYDAYTTTNAYPYSQSINLASATDGAMAGQVNYMRNSVKVTVDAYTGKMTYYLVDTTDPIAAAWSKAFPSLFTPLSEASDDLQAHFRYPENLFQVQATQFATYHVTDPEVFFQKQDVWQIPQDPTLSANNSTASGTMHPYYVLMRLPDSTEEHFQLILPFTPEGRQNMTSWMAANSDPEGYGRITTFTFPSNRTIDGPTQVFARIKSNSEFSQFQTLQGQQGSQVTFGDLLVIPLGDTLLYVVPAYVQSEQQNQQSIPELKKVAVVNGGTGGTVSIGNTLADALNGSLGQAPSGNGGTGGGTSPPATGSGSPPTTAGGGSTATAPPQVADLLTQALDHFTKADQALKAGDLAGYQTELAAAQKAVQQANELGTTGTTAAPATTAPPTTAPVGGATTTRAPTTTAAPTSATTGRST